MDPRALWSISFGMAISDMGSGYASDMGDQGDLMDALGDINVLDPRQCFLGGLLSPRPKPSWLAEGTFIDCLGICMFVSGVTVADRPPTQ